LPAINLSQDMAMITAVANDVGFAHVYTRQVLAHVGAHDCVVGISTSGNSENLLAGFAAAKRQGASTLGLAGGDGGRMRTSADVDLCLVVPTDSIHRVQETHVALYHILWDLTHTLLADDRGPGKAVR
jgi:D-sedoheptulose 7-phosphate isomerase